MSSCTKEGTVLIARVKFGVNDTAILLWAIWHRNPSNMHKAMPE
jgi:hypothetical protein